MEKFANDLEQEPLYHNVDLEYLADSRESGLRGKTSFLAGVFPPWVRLVIEAWMAIMIIFLSILLHQQQKILAVVESKPAALENQYPMPELGLHIEQSLNDSRYAHEHMFDSDEIFKGILHNWLELEPSGRGWVRLPDHDEYSIGPPYIQDPFWTGHYAPGYEVGAFHQLHCLSTIMMAYYDMRVGRTLYKFADDEHLAHCFDALRQHIMCVSDMTIEGNWTSPQPEKADPVVVSPWGSWHVCKNYDELKEWGETNKAWNLTVLGDYL